MDRGDDQDAAVSLFERWMGMTAEEWEALGKAAEDEPAAQTDDG